MLTINESTSFEADEWLHIIQMDKNNIINKCVISADAISRNDVWKESHMLKPYSERRMIRHSEKQEGALIGVFDEPGMTHILDSSPSGKLDK